ncbi:hypothetical protein IGI04_006663 [Brassica rapa subsp. trilocularis]|uniref:Uncharacterized protein n=1 Tax=Brassica rapa subsp. trilocularis TaxID=1813537 RepID=A0ABQ7NHK7_BRACM|nr:hypothetical protein IGI04_006663 [Brassica rapa subsp. trilocularis]
MVQDGGHELKVKEVGDDPHSQVQQSMAGFMKGSQEVFLVHHPSELKEEDFAHCVEQWRVEKEVVMRHWCEVSLKLTCKLGPILNPSLRRGAVASLFKRVLKLRQSTLGCEKMKATLSRRLLVSSDWRDS